jgi:PAS domain S-box-containing protein
VQFGNAWTQQLHPDDRKMVLSHWQQALATGTDFHFNCRIRRHDGVYRWFDTRGLPLRDPQGRIVKWFGTNTDVHETYETREALAANEGRLRYVTLATHDSVYDWDMPSGYTYRNDEFQSVFGAPPRTRSSDRWWENRIHPDDRSRIVDSATAAFRAHEPKWGEEYRLKRADGLYANVKDRAYLLYDENGKPARMIGAIEDITDRKHVEQSLRDARARLISAMEAGGLATWIWDVRTNEMLWDEAACRLWGQPPGEFQKFNLSKIRQVIHPDDLGPLIESTAEFRRTGIDSAVEFRTLRPDGALQWLLSKGQVEHDATGQAIRMVGVYVDITHRKRIEEAQLRTQKMEALGTLAGGIAHDFNNILLAIAGNAKLAAADLGSLLQPDHPVRRNLAEIDKASARAADLVRRILTFSRQQETQHDVLLLRPLIEEALRLLRPTLPAIVEIRTAFADNVGSVSTDAIQIHQVVMNLVTNAAHAIGEALGTIEITLNEKNVEALRPDLGTFLPGRYACLTVSDTGSGIENAIVDRIFDPFFTTKKAGQGTGLGLAVVHGIVKAHGGAITVDSESGKGTTFAVYFPIAATSPMQKIEAAETVFAPQLLSERGHVLYVDDEEALVFLTAKVLERLGYRVTGCVDPELALKELRAHPQSFDVLVTDLSMRGMNGFELTREARGIRGDLPVLLTSGYLRSEDRETAQQVGIREMILKPNSVEELGQAINRALIEIRSGMSGSQTR